jgi:secreted trypsin-like serine protease
MGITPYMQKFTSLILITIDGSQSSSITRSLIAPGPVTEIENYPFVAAILSCSYASNGALACGSFCTGSLIAPNLVLTAGHCVYDDTSAFNDPEPPVPLSQMYVLLGSGDSRKTSQGDVLVKVHSFVNKGYGMNLRYPMDGDFAILNLSDCVDLVPGRIETVRVATLDNEPMTTATTCTDIVTLGFGKITNLPDQVAYSDGKLRMLPDASHSFDTCLESYIGNSLLLEGYSMSYLNQPGNEGTKHYYETYLVPEYNSCVGGNSVHSSCNGDSGGPIVAKSTDGGYIQIGTTSFGAGDYCGFGADFITRLAPSSDFIRQYMDANTGSCPNWSSQLGFSSWPTRPQTAREVSTAYKSTRCQSTSQWQCEDGTCIQLSQVCDRVNHCPDNSDENSSYCSAVYRRSAVVRSSTDGGLTEKQARIQSELETLIAEADLAQSSGSTRILGETDNQPGVILLGPLSSFSRPTPKVPSGLVSNLTAGNSFPKDGTDKVALRAAAIDCSSIVSSIEAQIKYEKANGYNRLEEDPSPMTASCTNYDECVDTRRISPDGRLDSFCTAFSEFVMERNQALQTVYSFDSDYDNRCAQPPSYDSTLGESATSGDRSTSTAGTVANEASVQHILPLLFFVAVTLI